MKNWSFLGFFAVFLLILGWVKRATVAKFARFFGSVFTISGFIFF
jgi:hypothetical protein